MRRFNKQFKYREKVRDKGTAAITVVVYTCPRAFIRFVRVSFLDATPPRFLPAMPISRDMQIT